MPKINSCRKGKRGEVAWAKVLNKLFGLNAMRGQQRSGLEQADVVDGIPGTHAEVKWVESLNVRKAMDQALRDAVDQVKDNENWTPTPVPYVAHKRNNRDWLITIRASDLPQFVACVTNIPSPPPGDTHVQV